MFRLTDALSNFRVFSCLLRLFMLPPSNRCGAQVTLVRSRDRNDMQTAPIPALCVEN